MNPNSIFDTGALIDKGKTNLFDLSRENLFTADIGKLYPVYSEFLVPADRFKISVGSVIKSLPTLAPFYGQLDAQLHAFVVPIRLLWNRFQKWAYDPNDTTHMPPSILLSTLLNHSNTELADYLGVPAGVNGVVLEENQSEKRVNILKILAYHLIYNEYFRNESIQDDLTNEDGDPEDCFLNDFDTEDYNSICENSDAIWQLHYINWRRDYFTSCLPNSIAGTEPTLRLFSDGASAPVVVNLADFLNVENSVGSAHYDFDTPPKTNEDVRGNTPYSQAQAWKTLIALGFDPAIHKEGGLQAVVVGAGANQAFRYTSDTDADVAGHPFDPSTYPGNYAYANPLFSAGHQDWNYNTVADFVTRLGDVNSEVTANSLRTLFAVEKWLEINNITGCRYIEGTLAYYGVKVKDYRAQRPEYLGMTKCTININEVVSQFGDPNGKVNVLQGHRTGIMNSFNASRSFRYFCTEHSIVMFLFSLRPKSFYYQGLRKDWFILDQFDFPYRLFQHLGEQEVKDYELFLPPLPSDEDFERTFGYQSRYAEWRSSFNEVHGQMRTSLDFWHIGRKFSADDPPALSSQFVSVRPDSGDFNRVFPVAEETNHFICDLYFKVRQSRRLAYHSKPFLIS